MNPGTVRSLHRYPVKSMLGEEIPEALVTDRGLHGDRTLALLDTATGRIASAKQPRRWQRLLAHSAVHTGAGVRIHGPDGEVLDGDDPKAGRALSERLGRPVTLIGSRPPGAVLERAVPDEVLRLGADAEVDHTVHAFGSAAPPGTFFDHAPLHLLTTATLEEIARLAPRGTVEAARYRPNLVIDTGPAEGFPENSWVGRCLRIGPRLRIRVLLATPRCAVPTLAHGVLPRDPDALRVPARHNRIEPLAGLGPLPCAGVYAEVLRPGPVSRGDAVRFD
ncbi:MOSC N-terminal beta barrel domain-containing protein [Kitasatospora sp. NPDC048540]|uniref:MOSC domain-containing protein n=1 Tax=unclassified Kitasatospora TaxID=2633591 RepID=UPI000A690039|nr:MOSC N-terminal beta barrel domain-containing protein [Kitasatospora sp. MBT63]